MRKIVVFIMTFASVISLEGKDIVQNIFPGVEVFSFHIASNHYQLAFSKTKKRQPCSVLITLDDGMLVSSSSQKTINNVIRARIIQNSYTGNGFILACQHGPELGDVGCNGVYYVNVTNNVAKVQSLCDMLKDCDFGTINGVRGRAWGAYYVGEGISDMAIAVKVGYGIGTNQLFTIGLREFTGDISRIKQDYPFPLITEHATFYEREVKRHEIQLLSDVMAREVFEIIDTGTPTEARQNQ